MRRIFFEFIILLIAVSVVTLPGFLWGFGHIRPEGENEKDVMTMLGIVIGMMALFGAGAYTVIYIFIKGRLEEESEKMRHYATAQSLKGIAVMDYYRFLDKMNSDPETATKALESSEKNTLRGLRSAAGLCRLDSDSEYELLLCILKNNMAWIIYKKGQKERRYEAYEYIEYVITKAKKHPDHAGEWYDTRKKVCEGLFDRPYPNALPKERPLAKIKRKLCSKICSR